MTSKIENLKEEISGYYIKNLKKQVGWFKAIAVLPIQKPIKDMLMGKTELPEKFNEAKEFGRRKDIIYFISPELANEIFEYVKSKRMEIEIRKTEAELIQLKNEILGLTSENDDGDQSHSEEEDETTDKPEGNEENGDGDENETGEAVDDDSGNQDSTQESQDSGGSSGVTEGDEENGDGGENETGEAVDDDSGNQDSTQESQDSGGSDGAATGAGVAVAGGGGTLTVDKLAARNAARNAAAMEQLNEVSIKESLGKVVEITEKKRDALEHCLTRKEREIVNKNIENLKANIENADKTTVDVLKEWNKLGGKLNISRSILEQCGLTAKDLTKIGENADLIFKSDDIRRTLQDLGIKSIDESIVESFCKAGSASEIKSMTLVLKHGNKVSRMLQTLAAALWIDVAFSGLDVYMFIQQNKEAELISKVNKLRGKNKYRQAKRQLGIGISSVVFEALAVWMMGGTATGGPVGAVVGLVIGALTMVASVGVDSLYFDVADFYLQNQEDFLRQSRSQLKQAILQGIHNKKQGNESINESITSFFSPSLKPGSELKEKSLNDACVSMIFLEEIDGFGQFAYDSSLWEYVRSEKSKEDFLADKDQDYKSRFEETRSELEDRINIRMQYISKELEKPDIIKSIKNGTGMQDLTDIFTNSRIFADLKEFGKWDDSISLEENLQNYKSELLSDFPAEKIQKFESLKQNNPSLFQEIITTVSLDSFIYGEEDDEKDDDNNYVQNVKMVVAYQKILELTQSVEDRKYLYIDNVKNSKFIENLLISDFDLNKVEYPTLKPERVILNVNLNCERNGLTEISDNLMQNILYKLAKELFGYSEENDVWGLMNFFSESSDDVHGVYYSSKRKINDDWAIDTKLINNIPEVLHEEDIDKYVDDFINSNLYTPVYDDDGNIVGYTPKDSIDTSTESIDDDLNAELRMKIATIVREELSNHTVENQERIKNQISDFIKQHSKGEYIQLPYFLILEAKKAGLGDLQRQYFKRENNKMEICYMPSELDQKSIFNGCEKSCITPVRESLTEEEQYYVERVNSAYEKLESILTNDLGLPSDLHDIIVAKKRERNKFKEDVLLYDVSVVTNQDTINKYKEYAEYFENLYRGILMAISGFGVSNDIDNIDYYKRAMNYGNEGLFDNEGNLLEGIDGDVLGKQGEFREFYNEQIENLKIGNKTIRELWSSENIKEKELGLRASNLIYTTVLEYALIDGESINCGWHPKGCVPYIRSRYRKTISNKEEIIEKDEDKINKIIKTLESKFKDMRILPELDGTKISNSMKGQSIQQLTNGENNVTDTTPQVQEKIESTGNDLKWGGKRGDIEYDPVKKVIKSWGKEVEVSLISENNIKLKGLDLNLTLQEGVWLANFKNWLKYTYGDKKVEYTWGILNRSFSYRNTFYVGDTMLITRGDLEKYCPVCESDENTEKICERLNDNEKIFHEGI